MTSRKSSAWDVRRLAGLILAGVVIFVLAVAGMLVARSRTARLEPAGPAASSADFRIKEAELEEESGGVRWRLRAEEALVFEEERRTALKRISVKVLERERSWSIVGDEGDLFQQTSNVELRSNVVLTSSDGLRLETSVLRWQGAERRLWTDAAVRMLRDGAVIDGAALDVRLGDETTTMTGGVHAVFTIKQRLR